MAEYQEYLAILDSDPDDPSALAALEALGDGALSSPEAASALDETRRALRERGQLEAVERLLDVEIKAAADHGRRADLLLEKGHLYADELLNEPSAVECFHEVLELRPGDESAQEVLAHLGLVRDNWQKIVDKYLDEARVSTDRQLTTALYLSAAETYARYRPDAAGDIEHYLRKALEVDQRNRRAAIHLERLLRKQERWDELASLLEQRVDAAATREERIQALLSLADLAQRELERPAVAVDSMKKVVAVDPGHPRALRALAHAYEQEENWSGLVMLYTNALKARRRAPGSDSEVGMLLQIAMLHWLRLDNADAAEEYFRRVRKIDPTHPAALDFYRHYYQARGEPSKLLQVLRQAHKSVPGDDASRRRALSVEIAEVAETELGNPEKAIDAWKGILRAEHEAEDARTALKRLYRKTEKWNALLDLMKDEIDRLPRDDTGGRIRRLLDVVEIYRDRLKLDVMVINTYNSILTLDPDNLQALDALADKYQELSRWNDLIAVLSRKAAIATLDRGERARLYRDVSDIWIEQFGNYAQAVKPLEQLLEIAPGDPGALEQLKDIYTRRRQWRALIGLLEREAEHRPVEDRRELLGEMARLAAERLGDARLAIALWNRVLELPEAGQDEAALRALAGLYDRDKRYLALAEIYRRQAELPGDDRTAVSVLEKLGSLFADRLKAPASAAEVYRQILAIDAGHARAARTLRELYASAGDYDALERLYTQLEQWDDLVEAFLTIADRLEDRARKLDLLERAGRVASQHFRSPDKIARVYERVLGVDPAHVGAAQELVPLYRRLEKWARLLSIYEVLVDHTGDDERKLELHLEIRTLCEERLGSKALAFQWTARAYQLRPDDDQLIADLERLGAEADAWEEVAEILDRRADSEDIDRDEKLRLLRELGRIAAVRLHKPDKARDYQRRVLDLAPDDPKAMAALEEIATQQADWPNLLRVYRRRVELEDDDDARLDLLFKIAFLEEERLADVEAAVGTYKRILELAPRSRRALKALSKMQEARGDWAGLADVLERELELTSESDSKVTLLLRLGGLYEQDLAQGDRALECYQRALELAPHRGSVHRALERFLAPRDGVDAGTPVRVAQLLLPVYEKADDPENVARVIEVLREAAEPEAALEHDYRLLKLYGRRLERPEPAYDAALRVFRRRPEDATARGELSRLATVLERYEGLAEEYDRALSRDEGAPEGDTRRALLVELAALYDDDLGNTGKAEEAWGRVLAEDRKAGRAYDALDRIYRGAERWRELRDLLEQREANTADAGERKQILLQICDLNEGVLDDVDAAVNAYRRVLDLDPQLSRAYKALERLHEVRGEWRELEELLGRELDYAGADDERVELSYRRAAVRAEHLGDPQGAVDLLEEVVAQRRDHVRGRALLESLLPNADLRLRIARTLEPLYHDDGMWQELCGVLRAQREFATSSLEAVEMLARVAELEEERLGREQDAMATWIEALRVEPGDERPRRALERLAAFLDRWGDAAAAYEEAIEAADVSDVSVHGALLAELAEIYDRHVADTDRATSAYRRLLDVDPGNPATVRRAAEALARLYDEDQKWPELIDIIRRQADWAESTDERKDLLARAAAIHESRMEDAGAAVATWREVLSEDPDDERALDALERTYAAAEEFADLIEILRRRVEIATEPEDKKQTLRRIADIAEHQLADRSDAITAHLEILDHLPDDADTLAELSRLYREEKRHVDLLEIVERRLALTDDPAARGDLIFELGELLDGELERRAEALERYAEVLELAPAHEAAIAAIERLQDDDALVPRCAEILEPIYASRQEHGKLAALLQRMTAGMDDPRERMRNLQRVAQIRERNLRDPEGAFEIYGEVAREALAEPDLPDVVTELERLAAALEREESLIDIYREIAPDVLDGDLQRRLYLDIADLARAVRQDVELSRDYYQRVLDTSPDDERALNALEFIYRDAEEWDKLFAILTRKAELAADDADARTLALAESARLCSDRLGRPEDAALAWEQVLEIAPDHREAAAALEDLYQGSERWHDLADLLERRLGFAVTIEEAVTLRFRLGELYESKLHDPDTAVENYSAALGGDPSHSGATRALERFLEDPGSRGVAAEVLEPIYVSRQDWSKLAQIYEIKLEAAEDPVERFKLTRYVARLYEDQLEDLEGAFRWYGRLFRERPSDAGIRDQLVRLATILESWESLANIYQEFLDDDTSDTPEVRDVALALADIYDRRLGEIERGQTAYRRALQAAPGDTATFGRLESMLIRGERWYALIDVYEDAIQSSLEDDRREALSIRMARIHEQHLHDPARAIDAYRSVLDLDPTSSAAADELERLYGDQEQWFDLAELLGARVERAAAAQEEHACRLRLAQVLEERLEDPGGAVDQYETIIGAETDESDGVDAALAALERLVLEDQHRERITAILEPVYRAHDWWQKLVVILDARLEYIDDPAQRVASLREIAGLHEARGGDPNLALKALSRAWLEDIGDEDIYDELSALAAKLAAWDDLVATLERGIVDQYDFDLVARVLARIAHLHDTQRSDNPSAIRAWRRLLDVQDDDPDALAALDRLLAEEGDHAELVQVVQRRADLADDPSVRIVLLRRVATIEEEKLERATEAIAAHKNVLGVDETDAEALDALDRLYRAEEDWAELATVLTRKIELTGDAAARRPLYFEAARVYDAQLGDVYEAIAQLRAVLDESPDDGDALAELDRLYERESMWPELLEVIDRRGQLADDADARAELGFRAAKLVQHELMEPETAIGRYAEVLDLSPTHEGARRALDLMTTEEDTLDAASEVLERVLREEQSHDRLVELYERRLKIASPDPAVRGEQYAALAELHEISRGDGEAAFEVWARALAEAPEDASVQGQLERLAADRGAWAELAAILESRLAEIVDAELEYAYASRLGQLYEEAMDDLERAAASYRRALDASPGSEEQSLLALARIYERAGKYGELAETLARQAEATLDESDQAELLFRLGDVREQALSDLPAAVSAYREVLDRVPRHGAARAALERLLSSGHEESEIIAILEPLYEGEGDFERLADLLVTKLGITEDRFDRVAIYSRVAEIAESELGDPVRALDAAGGWLAEDPQSEQALGEVERLAEDTDRWGEVAARLSGIVGSSDDDDVNRPLLTKLGQIQLDRLADLDAAERSFQGVLEVEAESATALESLERIHRTRGDDPQLAEVLRRRGELAFDAAAKRACFAEVADLRERLGDGDGAVTAWREVLEIDEGDRDAHARLASLHERAERWDDLIDTLEMAARFAPEPEEERQLRTRVADLFTRTVGDLERAVEAWQAVIDVAPDDADALTALEEVHARREDWLAVQEVLTRRLDLAASDADRIPVFQRLAGVAERERDSVDEAVGYLQQILDIDDAHLETHAELDRLLSANERWHELVELLERRAEVASRAGDAGAEVAALARSADIWEGPLDNPDAAGEILERILARDPDSVPALTRLSKIYEGAGDWDRCTEVLERAVALGPSGRDAADLYYRLGEVTKETSGNEDRALEHFSQALQFDGGHQDAVRAVEAIAREREDWAAVADMVTRREVATRDPAEKLELTLELAELYRDRLGRPEAVIPILEQTAAQHPDDARVRGPLADVYFASGRTADAAPIYEELAEAAKKKRKMKEVARYRQRLGGIFEATGEPDRALASYEEAFRVNPTDVATMTGLGRLYLAREEWEKARRVYRSLVLQNIDPSVGVTKADVYYHLGTIHVKLGEPQKAKGMFQRGLELEPDNQALRDALSGV